MNVEPLKKELYNKAKELGMKRIVLHFSGGSDEGFLDIEFIGGDDLAEERILYGLTEDWVWEVYEYSGAGDGSSYGDNIVYDLENGRVTTQEWGTVEQMGEAYSDTLETR